MTNSANTAQGIQEVPTMDIIADWDMIVAGIYQTYGYMDISKVRARDLFNIMIPNMSKDTVIMNIARIRATPTKKLSEEERKIKNRFRIRQPKQAKQSGADLFKALASIAKGGK